MVGLEWKVNDWRHKWFLVEPPAGRCVGCPIPPQRHPLLKLRREVALSEEAKKFKQWVTSLSCSETCWDRYDVPDRLVRAGIGFCQERMEFPLANVVDEETPSPSIIQGKKRNGDSLTASQKRSKISNPDSSKQEVILSSDSENSEAKSSSCLEEVVFLARRRHQTEMDESEKMEEVAGGGIDQAGRVEEEGRSQRDNEGAAQENGTSDCTSGLQQALELEAKSRALSEERLRNLRDYVVKVSEDIRNETTTMTSTYGLLKTTLDENENLKSNIKELQSAMDMQFNLTKKLETENESLMQEVERLKQQEGSHAKSLEVIEQMKKDNNELRLQVDKLKAESTSYQMKLSKADEMITNLNREKKELNRESETWRIKMIRAEHQASELSTEKERRDSLHTQLLTRCQALKDEVSALNREVEREAEERSMAEKARREAESRARQSEAKFRLALAPVVRQGAEQGIALFKDYQNGKNKELAAGFILDPSLIKIPTELVNPDPALLDGIGYAPIGSSRKASISPSKLVKEDPSSS